MKNTVLKVGMREFRASLHQYLNSSSPVAVTRHGETIGFYIPTKHHQEPGQAQIDVLKEAAIQMKKLISAHGLTEDQLLADFKALREKQKGK